ncbi:MAG: glycoside hydrolase family 5 protein [Lentisphaerae bacterium]|nr:glycoside hydrolase family 5 protein [Lentisphaerota bacterium]
MLSKLSRFVFSSLLIAVFTLGATVTAAPKNLVANGDVKKSNESGGAENWPTPKDGISYPVEDGNRFLRITSTKPGGHFMIYHPVPIPAGTEALKMTFKVRWNDVERGGQSWFDARIMMEFKDDNHATVKGAPGAPNFHGTSESWQTRELMCLVPDGAKFLALMPSLFQAKKGQLDIDDIVITPIKADDIKAAKEAEARKKAAAEFAAIVWSVTLPVPEGIKTEPLKVKGNRLVSMKTGEEVWLQGVAIASMEWTAGGENILKSVEESTEVWGANVIRLALKSTFWFGNGPWQKDKGKNYRELVDKVVTICQRKGVYVVLDLHEYRAASGRHATFWKDVATRYKDHPGVIFGLLNEPHGITWKEWRDGGDIAAKTEEKEGVFSENQENLDAMKSIGMQGLVNAVRATGARNLLSASGLDWGYDLSGILDGYALKDSSNGQGIMYETHVYPWKSSWKKNFINAAEKYPLLMGEVGCQIKAMPWESKATDPYVWAPNMIGCIQEYRINWTAWCFHPSASPCLLENWEYKPTPYWGEFVMRALKGEKFEYKAPH